MVLDWDDRVDCGAQGRISDGKVKTSETEREWKMGKTLETLETLEKQKVRMGNGLRNLVHNKIVL